jgi:ABC-type cobalamin transport system ATPase subunit
MTPDEGLAVEHAKLSQMQQIFAAWPVLRPYLLEIRQEHVEKLILREDNELRGRIKQLDDLLQLPDSIARAQHHLSGLPE